MGLIASGAGGGTDWEPLPTGTHLARCITVCDLGVQQTNFGSKEQVYIGWEVPGVRVKWEKDGKEHDGPALIGQTYTLSVHPKSVLGQHLVSWRGKEFTPAELEAFDVFQVLGAPCMISVIHNIKGNKTYANIAAIMRVPQGTPMPPAEGEQVAYTATDPAYSGTLEKLPQWLKDKAIAGQRQSPVEPEAPPPYVGDDFEDSIPF